MTEQRVIYTWGTCTRSLLPAGVMDRNAGKKVSEKLVASLWKHLWRKESLVTSSGRRIQVMFPGRENEDSGPDFLGAIIATDEGLWRGDIEVHVQSEDWQAHGHHQDPRYNGVILHIVWHNGGGLSYRQSGEGIPVLSLESYAVGDITALTPEIQLPLFPREPCRGALERLEEERFKELLDRAGWERFQVKAKHFAAELRDGEQGQVLYRGIMEALGYARNKQPFRKMAQELPLAVAQELSQNHAPAQCQPVLQALFLGTAGLLPRQRRLRVRREERWARELEQLWESLGRTSALEEREWHFFRVRPENFPTRRLAAMGSLLAQCREEGLFPRMLREMSQASPEGYKGLEQALEVAARGYWAKHFDFGVEVRRELPTLIGQGRAREIVVNILLPFFHAWGDMAFQVQLKEKARELYQRYPPLEGNRLIRLMEKFFWDGHNARMVGSAKRQQGLIHLYQVFCSEGRCEDCPLRGTLYN